MRYLPVLVIALSLLTSPTSAEETQIPKKITIEEADIILSIGLGWKTTKYNDYDKNGVYDRFYGFAVLGAANGFYGFYSVNVWTGDVWDDRHCTFLSTPKLRKAQAKIKKRFTRKELKQYKKLHALKPECLYP